VDEVWTNVTRPGDLFIAKDGTVYVGEMGWEKGTLNMAAKPLDEDRPSKLTIRDHQGNVLAQWGASEPCAVDGFAAPHGLWVDSRGDIYVGEVTQTALSGFFKNNPYHPGCASLTKFAKV
jgi:hypothetical protein